MRTKKPENDIENYGNRAPAVRSKHASTLHGPVSCSPCSRPVGEAGRYLRPARIVAEAPLFAAALFGVCVLLAVIVVLVDWIARLLTE